ncbi:glycosyl hydrolase family 95 catalytic domain-containing protein [Longispora fulva]|uniref:Alpha-L-fucosidase 2 n=1 Tax=Longispora fulva TaxID=619741 RepID=A0A8J7G9F3_9ACTN|nr:glycoside hydrolase N-terminal domain-containing protein [Longispora fulva]MBG6134094.1 alpha-L-fucosidase 2 [Longispora fulva]
MAVRSTLRGLEMTPSVPDQHPSRRDVLRIGGAVGAFLTLGGLPVFAESALAADARPTSLTLVPAGQATTLWYPTPAVESRVISEGLAIGNGRLGALVGGDPSNDFLYLSDATLWTGTLNGALDGGGQFPYNNTTFGAFQLLAKAYLAIPAHTTASITNYKRQLDLSNGYVSASYQLGGVTYTREVYASHPDDVIVVRLKQSGGGSYTGSVSLNGTHSNTTTASGSAASFGGTLANGLKYAAAVKVANTGGSVSSSGAAVTFTNCSEVVVILTGGTNYTPDLATSYKDAGVDPKAVATAKAAAAAAVSGDTLLATHVADYQALYNTMTVNLGASTAAQRGLDTAARLTARGTNPAPSAADPELEASYLQFGRYLTITGSRGSLPTNLQGLWLDHNDADQWLGDYHTDINLQMNYWLPDRAGLSACFDPLVDYCLAQVPSWTTLTQQLFNDSRNRYRNSSGRVAGWTTAISSNIFGGLGWDWHPAGNAWLCNSLMEHYEYTQDRAYLQRIYTLVKGACQFWEVRLVSKTITSQATGQQVTVLVDDSDWSPEQGGMQQGVTYAQELVWQLFDYYRKACDILGVDATYAATIKGLQDKLFLPEVSTDPQTPYLEEWMQAPTTWGDLQHRHLSPLAGLFPGDRITTDASPTALVNGARGLLTARGLNSYGWATAWRSLCWSRLKNAANAYQTVLNVIGTSSTARNLFDMYSSTTFQIDANYGTPAAMLDMLVYSRPGLIELLPALPGAWATGSVTGIGARGGFTVDLTWANGAVTSATLRGVAGTSTVVRSGSWSQVVVLPASGSATVTPSGTSSVCVLVNRQSGKAIDVPGSSTQAGAALIAYTRHGNANQQWRFTRADTVHFTIANVNSNLVMDVSGGSAADGAAIIQWNGSGSTNQQWRLDDAGGGYVKLVSARSGKVIGVDAGSSIVQQTDTGATSQHWRLDQA